MPLGDGLALQPLPPQEAIDFFRQKGYSVSFDWRDVWQAEHQSAFTVAKAMTVDLLQDIRGATDEALANGTTVETFRQKLQPLLIDKGWWGKTTVTDPQTGDDEVVQLGSPRRLKTIYDTNLRTAYKEGQWQRIQDTRADFPLLLYDGLNSVHPRQSHVPYDGKVLAADNPWWQAHMPVCAWGCKCRVVQLTQAMADALGYKVELAMPSFPDREYVNQRTGELQRIPYGVDPEFHYPPALPRNQKLSKALFDKLDQADARVAGAVYPTLDAQTRQAISQEYGAWAAGIKPDAPGETRRVVAAVPPRVLQLARERGASYNSAMVSVWAEQAAAIAKVAPAVAADLPAALTQASSIRWDETARSLVYVLPDAAGEVAIGVQLGRPLPGGGSENRVNSVREVAPGELDDLVELWGNS